MSRIIPIATYLILSLLTGTVLYVVWKLIDHWIEKRGYVDINYWIWKIVLLAFLCPIPFGIILKMRKKGLYGFSFWQTKTISIVIAILCSIWSIGTIIYTVRYIRKHVKVHKMISKTGYEDSELTDKIEEYCSKLQLHRNVKVVNLEFMEIPMVYGLLNPKILMPKKKYSEQELEIILLHELVHHKHHDLFWKQLFQIIRCIYWFHPAMKDILKQLDQWGETSCDMTVSKNIKSVKEYFRVIIEMTVDTPEYDVYMAGLCEGTENIKLRMLRMKAYMNKKPLRRMVSVGVMFGIAGVSTATVMASSVGVARGYSYAIDKTNENNVSAMKDGETKTEKVRKIEKDDKKIIKFKEKIPSVGNIKVFKYDLKKGERLESRNVYIKKGRYIELSVSSGLEEDGDSKDIETGIMDKERNAQYINDSCNLDHYFKIEKDGDYTIYIENYGEEDVQIVGIVGLKKKGNINEESN